MNIDHGKDYFWMLLMSSLNFWEAPFFIATLVICRRFFLESKEKGSLRNHYRDTQKEKARKWSSESLEIQPVSCPYRAYASHPLDGWS